MNKPFNINTNTNNNHSNSNNSNTTTSNNNSKTTQLNSIIISKSIFEFYSLINFTFNNNSNENKLTSISLSSTSIKSKTAKITISNNYHTYTITYYISKDIFFRLTQNYEPSSYITETKLIDNEIEITFTFTLDNIINIFYHIDYEACIKSTEPLTSLQNKNVKIYFHLNHFDYTCTYSKKSKDNNTNTNTNTYSYTKHNVSLFIYRDFNDEINNMKFLFPIITFQLSMRHLLTMMFNDDIKDKFMKGNDEYNYHINITHNDISLNTCCSLKYENVLMCHFIYFCILVSYGVITYYELCAFMEKYANEVNALYQSNAAKFVLCLKMICKEHLHAHYKDKIPLTKEQLYNEIKKKINSNNSLSCVVSTYHGKDYCEIPVICVEQYFVRFEFYHKEKSFLFYRKYGNNDICRLNVVTNKVWNCKCKFTKQFLNGILKGFKLKNKIYSLLTYNVSQLNMFSCIMLSKNGSNSNGNSKQQFDLFMLENYFLPSKTIEFGNVNLQLKKDYKGKHNERQITLSQGVAPIMPEIISKISSQLNTNIKRLPYIHCFTSLYHKGIWMECKSSTHKQQQQQQEITFYYRQSQNYPTTNNSNTSASMKVHSFNLHVIDYPVNKCYSNCYLTLEMVLYLIYDCKVSVACIYDLIEHNIKYYCTLLSQTSFYSNSHFIHRVLSSIQKYNLINNSFIYKIHKILLHTKQYTLIDHPKLIITNSAVLQGIVDEYGLIKNDNEVIVVLRNIYTNNMKLILKGKGILTRIPCIHASNFRKVYFYSPTNKQLTKHQLNAYNYYINNFHNVIIFPSYEHKHSLLNDLNVRSFASNKFGVIWDTNIVKSFHETKACDIMNNLLSTRNNTTTSSSSSSTCEYTITNFTTIAGKHFKHKVSSQIEDLIEHNYLNSKLHSLSETLAKIEDMYYVYGNEEIKPITSLKKHFINKCIKKPIVKTIITNAKRYLEQERLHTPLYMNNDTKALMIHYIESHSHMIEFYIEKVNIILNYICVFNSKCNDVLNEIDETSYEGMFLTLFDKSKRYSVFVKEFVEEYNVDKVIKELTECKYKYDITLVMLVCAMISYNLVYHTCYMKDVYERYYDVVMNKQKQVIAQDVCVHCMEAFEYQMHSFGMGDNEKVQSLIYLLDTYTTVTYSNSGNSSSSNEMTICESEYNKTINNFNILMNNKYGSNPFIPFCFSEYISILKISSEYNESI